MENNIHSRNYSFKQTKNNLFKKNIHSKRIQEIYLKKYIHFFLKMPYRLGLPIELPAGQLKKQKVGSHVVMPSRRSPGVYNKMSSGALNANTVGSAAQLHCCR